MKIVLVDDDEKAVQTFMKYIENIRGIETVEVFSDGLCALAYAKENKVDLAVLGLKLPGMDGITLGQWLRVVCPDVLLIFTTYMEGCEEELLQAVKMRALSYLMKPYVQRELEEDIQTAMRLLKRKERIFIKTFGHFDVFVEDKPIMFRSNKAKELLALLVDRQGGTVNTEQIICALWEDRPNDEATQNLCCKTTRTLKRELKEHGAEKLLVINRSMKRVDTEYFACDLYDLLSDKEHAKKQFVGDYMLDYSWAEDRMASLSKYL